MTVLPGSYAAYGYRSERGTMQVQDGVVDGCEHTAHLALPSLTYGDLDPRRCCGVQSPNPGRSRHAIFERHSGFQKVECMATGASLDGDLVELLDVKAWVKQTVCEISIGREEKSTGRVAVEATDREQTGRLARNEFSDGRATLRVTHRGHVTGGLVQHEICRLRRQGDDAVVDLDHVHQRIHARSELTHDTTVDPHPTGRHEVFAAATRCDTRAGKKTLQSHRHDALVGRSG